MKNKILLVEDEEDTAHLLKTVLEREGFSVIRARDGRQATAMIETIQPPSLILLDLVVPYVSGSELMKIIRQHSDWQHIPIIVVSADSYEPDIERALLGGATAYVMKQTGAEGVLHEVRRILSPSVASEPAPGETVTKDTTARQPEQEPGRMTFQNSSTENDQGGPMGTAKKAPTPTVLMIEDHDDTACLIRFILERNGYVVRHAPDGWNAKRLTETTEPPDLVLLDISLPSLSGLELLRIIRTTPEWQWIPVIMLTSDTRMETKDEATNLGATEYLKKPFTQEHLMKAIEPFLPRPIHQ